MKRRSFIAACVALIVAPFGVKTGKATLPRIRTYTVEELQPMVDALVVQHPTFSLTEKLDHFAVGTINSKVGHEGPKGWRLDEVRGEKEPSGQWLVTSTWTGAIA